jgi:hypothetical protein
MEVVDRRLDGTLVGIAITAEEPSTRDRPARRHDQSLTCEAVLALATLLLAAPSP